MPDLPAPLKALSAAKEAEAKAKAEGNFKSFAGAGSRLDGKDLKSAQAALLEKMPQQPPASESSKAWQSRGSATRSPAPCSPRARRSRPARGRRSARGTEPRGARKRARAGRGRPRLAVALDDAGRLAGLHLLDLEVEPLVVVPAPRRGRSAARRARGRGRARGRQIWSPTVRQEKVRNCFSSTARGFEMSKKSVDCGLYRAAPSPRARARFRGAAGPRLNFTKVALGRDTFFTESTPPSSSMRFCIIQNGT